MRPDDSLASDSRGSVVIGIVIILAFLVLLVAAATFTGFTGSSSNAPGDLPAEGEAAQLEAELQAALTEQSGVFSTEDDDWSFSPVHGNTGVVDFDRLEASLKEQGLLPQQRYWVQRAIDDVVAWDDEPPITTVEPRPANSTNATLVRTPDQLARVQTTDILRSGDGELRDTVISIESASVGFGVTNKTVLTVDGVVIELWRDKTNLDQVWHQMTNSDGSAITDGAVPIDIDQQQMLTIDIADNQVNGQALPNAYTGPGAADGFLLERSPSTQTLINVTSTAPGGATSVSFTTLVENRTANGTAPQVAGALGDPTVLQPVEKQQVVGTAVFSIVNTNTETTSVEEVTINPEYQAYAPPERTPDFALDSLNIQSYGLNDPLNTAVSVSNTGTAATGTLVYEVTRDGNRQTRNKKQIFLRNGESRTLTFDNYITNQPGSYTARAFFAGNSARDTVQINAPANVVLRDLSLTTVAHTERVDGTATVVNTGGTAVTETFRYTATPNGETGTRSVRVSAGATKLIQFTGPRLSERGVHTITGEISGDKIDVSTAVGIGNRQSDLSLTDVSAAIPGSGQYRPLVTTATVTNTGNTETTGELNYRVPDTTHTNSTTITLKSGETKQVIFDGWLTTVSGYYTGTVSLANQTKSDTAYRGSDPPDDPDDPDDPNDPPDDPDDPNDPPDDPDDPNDPPDDPDDPNDPPDNPDDPNDPPTDPATFSISSISAPQNPDPGVAFTVTAFVTKNGGSGGGTVTFSPQGGAAGVGGTGSVSTAMALSSGPATLTASVSPCSTSCTASTTIFVGVDDPRPVGTGAPASSSTGFEPNSQPQGQAVGSGEELSLGELNITGYGLSETVDATVTVRNTGTQPVQSPVVFRIGGEERTKSVNLSPGQGTTVSFDYYTIQQPGEYEAHAAFGDQSASTVLSVDDSSGPGGPELSLGSVNIVDSGLGAPLETAVTVNNSGTQRGTGTLVYRVAKDGTNTNKTEVGVVLNKSEEKTVVFDDYTIPSPGTYSVTAEFVGETGTDSTQIAGTEQLVLTDLLVSKYTPGEPISGVVALNNTGSEIITETLRYSVSSENTGEVKSKPVSIRPGQEQTVEFTLPSVPAPGDYVVGAEIAGQTKAVSADLTTPANDTSQLKIVGVSVTDNGLDKPLITTVSVKNTGEQAETDTVAYTLTRSGSQQHTAASQVTVKPDIITSVRFDGYTARSPGTYRADASFAGDSGSDTVTIKEPPKPYLVDVTTAATTIGEPVYTTVEVINIGGQKLVDEPINLTVGLTENSTTVTLEPKDPPFPGKWTRVEFVNTEISDVGGYYTATAEFAGMTLSDTGCVSEPVDEPCSQPPPGDPPGDPPGGGDPDPGPEPDLNVGDVTVTGSYGEGLTTDVKVINNGDASGSGDVSLNLSPPTGTTGGIPSDKFISLDPGDSTTVSFTGPVVEPDSNTTYTVEGSIAGSDEQATITITPPSDPPGGGDPGSLALQNVTITNSGLNEFLNAEMTVKNTGGDPVTGGTLLYEALYFNSLEQESRKDIGTLNPGDSATLSFTNIVNVNDRDGNWQVQGTIEDVTCNPCTASDSVNIDSGGPASLAVTSVTAPESVTENTEITATVTIENTGGASKGGDLLLRTVNKNDQEVDPPDTKSFDPISGGGEKTVEYRYTPTELGQHTAEARFTGDTKSGCGSWKPDPQECGGSAVYDVTVTSPTVEIQSVSAPDQVTIGESVDITAEIKNTDSAGQASGEIDFTVIQGGSGGTVKQFSGLGSGQTEELTYTYRNADNAGQTYTVKAAVQGVPCSTGCTESVSFTPSTLPDPPEFSIDTLDVSGTFLPPATVETVIKNIGEQAGSVSFSLEADGQTKSKSGITLSPDETASLTIEVTTADTHTAIAKITGTGQSGSCAGDCQETKQFTVGESGGQSEAAATGSSGPSQTGLFAQQKNTIGIQQDAANVDGLSILGLDVVEHSQGSPLKADVTVGNGGAQVETKLVSLSVGTYSTTQQVTVPPNSTETMVFDQYVTENPGTYTVKAEFAGQTLGVPITVHNTSDTPTDPAQLSLTGVDIVNSGLDEQLETAVSVTNTGGRVGSGTVDYTVTESGTTVESQAQSVTIKSGGTRTLSFDDYVTDTAGTYVVTATLNGQTQTESVTIENNTGPAPGQLAVDGLSITNAGVNENLEAQVSVTNVGGRSLTGDLTFTASHDGSVEYDTTREVSLPANNGVTMVFGSYQTAQPGDWTIEATITRGNCGPCSQSTVVPITGDPPGGGNPDLTVDDVTVTGSHGNDLSTEVTVINNGGASGSGDVSLNLSPTTGTTSPVPGEEPVSLGPGDSTTVSFTGPTVEPDSKTTYTVTASITGDTGQATITITPPSDPPGGGDPAKLDVTEVDVRSKGLNQDLVVEVTVKNNGGETLTETADLKYTAYKPPGSQQQSNIRAPSPTKKSTGQLASGESTVLSFDGVTTENPGPWSVDATLETNADCGTCSDDAFFQIEDTSSGPPDVQVTRVSASPSSVTLGQTVTTTVTIENKGGGDMPETGNLLTRVVDSSDQKVESDTKTFGPIPAKSSETVTFSAAPTDPDTYTAEARLDRNTDADCGTWQPIPPGCGGSDTFTVDTVSEPAAFSITGFTASDATVTSSRIKFNVTVQNDGDKTGSVSVSVGTQDGSAAETLSLQNINGGSSASGSIKTQIDPDTYTGEASIPASDCADTGTCTMTDPVTIQTLPDPAAFSLSISTSGEFSQGSVTGEVTNTGDQQGSVTLKADVVQKGGSESKTRTLSPGETLSVTEDVFEQGTWTGKVTITSADGNGCTGSCSKSEEFTVGPGTSVSGPGRQMNQIIPEASAQPILVSTG